MPKNNLKIRSVNTPDFCKVPSRVQALGMVAVELWLRMFELAWMDRARLRAGRRTWAWMLGCSEDNRKLRRLLPMLRWEFQALDRTEYRAHMGRFRASDPLSRPGKKQRKPGPGSVSHNAPASEVTHFPGPHIERGPGRSCRPLRGQFREGTEPNTGTVRRVDFRPSPDALRFGDRLPWQDSRNRATIRAADRMLRQCKTEPERFWIACREWIAFHKARASWTRPGWIPPVSLVGWLRRQCWEKYNPAA